MVKTRRLEKERMEKVRITTIGIPSAKIIQVNAASMMNDSRDCLMTDLLTFTFFFSFFLLFL
jgi:hypothetical protein